MAPVVKVVAVIPAWNEEGNIGRVVADIPRDMCPHVVVVDNASTDGTARVAREAGAIVVSQPKRGYGHACAAGVAKAHELGADVVVFLDGDYSDYPEEMPAVVGPVLRGEADMVIGSRLRGGMPRGALPAHAVLGNRLISAVMRLRFGVRITDLGPFHAISAPVLRELGMREMTYGWTVEMIVKAARGGYRIAEVPVRYRRRLSGESKVSGNAAASIRAAARILAVTLRHAI
ncbi:MAG TPA: glycosyltransferase family 2 protein [Chloroflexia bacterium]|nr:glycosyltransferase family 2 protein [Chloroflexia bacterium]